MAAGVRFLYIPCSDVAQMREFYGLRLGLGEIYWSADERMVAYDCSGLQFTIFESSDVVPAPSGWAIQPGWEGGQLAVPSWSVPMTDEEFGAAVEAVCEAGDEVLSAEPRWVGYWSFPAKDPMGNTVELTNEPVAASEDATGEPGAVPGGAPG